MAQTESHPKRGLMQKGRTRIVLTLIAVFGMLVPSGLISGTALGIPREGAAQEGAGWWRRAQPVTARNSSSSTRADPLIRTGASPP